MQVSTILLTLNERLSKTELPAYWYFASVCRLLRFERRRSPPPGRSRSLPPSVHLTPGPREHPRVIFTRTVGTSVPRIRQNPALLPNNGLDRYHLKMTVLRRGNVAAWKCAVLAMSPNDRRWWIHEMKESLLLYPYQRWRKKIVSRSCCGFERK